MTTYVRKGCSTKVSHRRCAQRRVLSLIIACCFGWNTVLANPLGPQVMHGQVGFSTQGNLLSITNSPGAIIHWQGFSINSGEITRFIQQNPTSSVLNRIVGQDPSTILGALQSNGKVFLINPNGILFGSGAQVDVNSLVASTLDLSNSDFLAGRLHFSLGEKAADIHNRGVITTPAGGQVFLVASNVDNSGIITAPNGDVALAAGQSVSLVDSTNPAVHVVVSAPENAAVNLGQIVAQSGRIGIYGALVTQRGIVNANSAVVGDNGKIVFKASRDTLLEAGSKTTASGAGKGGTIEALGARVALVGDAEIDVSGAAGGGTVLVGGDYQGKNLAIQNAQQTYLGDGAKIKANALEIGDGGKIIVWADELTRAYGVLSARGGGQGGNGGFVEVSGKRDLDFKALADLRAPHGVTGSLLLDPTDITIRASSVGPTTPVSVSGTGPFIDSGGDSVSTNSSAVLRVDTLQTQLGLANVTVTTTGGLAAPLGGKITVASPISWRTSNTLTLAATNGIGINAAISHDGDSDGSLILSTVAGDITQTAALSVPNLTAIAGGAVVLTNPANHIAVLTGSGGTGFSFKNAGELALGAVSSLTGPIAIETVHGDLDITTSLNHTGSLTLTAGSSNALHVNSEATLTGASVTLSGGSILARRVTATDGAVNITSYDGGIVVGNISAPGAVTLSGSGSGETRIGNVTTTGGAVSLTSSDSGSDDSMTVGAISTSGGAVGIASASPLITSGIDSGGGAVSLKADRMTLSEGIDAGSGAVALMTSHHSTPILLGASSPDTESALAFSALDLKAITTSNRLVIGDTAMNAPITVTSALDLTSHAGLTGTLLLNAGSGNIAVNAPLSVPATLLLNTTGAIEQTANGALTATALNAVGSRVILDQTANPASVIAGSTSAGDFRYRSAGGMTVGSVDTVSGITVPGSGNIKLISDSSSGITQTSGSPLIGGALALQTIGPVTLTNANNSVSKVAADLNPGGVGGGSLAFFNTADLDVNTVSSLNGMTTHGQSIWLTLAANKRLTVNRPIDAGSSEASFGVDLLTLNNTVGGDSVSIRPYSRGRKMTIGATACNSDPCLLIRDLYNVTAPTLSLGSDEVQNSVGDIYVAGITASTRNAVADRNANTTRIGLLSAGNITQLGAIDVPDLGIEAGAAVNLASPANTISNLAGSSVGNFTFVNAQALNVASLSGGVAPHHYSLDGVVSDGNLSLSSRSGNLIVAEPIRGDAISLIATSGAIAGDGNVSGASLMTRARDGITLSSHINSLQATNSGTSGSIRVTNVGALSVLAMAQTARDSLGSIVLNNDGALTIAGPVSVAGAGGIQLRAHSPLTVASAGSVNSTSGDIVLEAGASGSANDKLTVNGSVYSASGAITLIAGDAIIVNGTVTGHVTSQANGNHPVPSVASAEPTLPALPNLRQCIADPTAAGCGVVLPSLAQCAVTPSLTGCDSVSSVAQSRTNDSLTQSVNSAAKAMNTASDAVVPPVAAISTAVSENSSKASNSIDDAKSSGNQDEMKKEHKKETVAATDHEEKKNGAAPKMYCN